MLRMISASTTWWGKSPGPCNRILLEQRSTRKVKLQFWYLGRLQLELNWFRFKLNLKHQLNFQLRNSQYYLSYLTILTSTESFTTGCTHVSMAHDVCHLRSISAFSTYNSIMTALLLFWNFYSDVSVSNLYDFAVPQFDSGHLRSTFTSPFS